MVAGQWRDVENLTATLSTAAVESFRSQTAAIVVKQLQTGTVTLAIGLVHVAFLRSCMSDCTVPQYTFYNRQTNWTLGIKHALARDGLPSVTAL